MKSRVNLLLPYNIVSVDLLFKEKIWALTLKFLDFDILKHICMFIQGCIRQTLEKYLNPFYCTYSLPGCVGSLTDL